MRRLVFDLETDGFLEHVTKVHCAVTVDVDTGEVRSFSPHWRLYQGAEPMEPFLELYQDPDVLLIGHNVIKYDCPVMAKLYGIVVDKRRVLDTMVLGRLVYPDIKVTDFQRAAQWRDYHRATEQGYPWLGPIPREFPTKCIGLHSLKAWGYRLGRHKGEYDGGWDSWSPAMHDYMLQDGAVTAELFQRLMAHDPSPESVELEHRIAWLCAQIERNGFPFDVRAASELYGRLVDEREGLRRELIGLFPNWRERLPDFIPARNNQTRGYVAGEPVERWREHEFNPTSRDHIANRLQAKYGWRPTDFTDGGKPQVDDEVLAKLPFPEAQRLARYFLLDKRIGQLAEGAQAWLKVQQEGKIHASYNTNGALTGRATHSRPNISQVPRVSSEFGRDCRALFHAPPGWVLVGADQAGLELRCLASDMSAFDGGDYAIIVTQGDVHTTNMLAFCLFLRDSAKTAIYAVCYGAGDEKLGSIAEDDARKAGKPLGRVAHRTVGRRMRENFETKVPAFRQLVKHVKTAASRGWIKGLDGRKMPIRSDHAALNTRLQNSGAIICKRWGCDWDDALQAEGLKHGWDGDYVFVSWSHDEYQLCVRDDATTIATVRRLGVETGRNAGKPYNFNCPLDVETKVGATWAETH